jgi:hypothetical protein
MFSHCFHLAGMNASDEFAIESSRITQTRFTSTDVPRVINWRAHLLHACAFIAGKHGMMLFVPTNLRERRNKTMHLRVRSTAFDFIAFFGGHSVMVSVRRCGVLQSFNQHGIR